MGHSVAGRSSRTEGGKEKSHSGRTGKNLVGKPSISLQFVQIIKQCLIWRQEELSYGRRPPTQAALITQVSSRSEGFCLQLWHHSIDSFDKRSESVCTRCSDLCRRTISHCQRGTSKDRNTRQCWFLYSSLFHYLVRIYYRLRCSCWEITWWLPN